MTMFDNHDAFLLAELAQYRNLSEQRKLDLLGRLSSDEAKQTGRAILYPGAEYPPEIRSAAQAFVSWADGNRASARSRTATSRRSYVRSRLAHVS
jgi:hypothetical protein